MKKKEVADLPSPRRPFAVTLLAWVVLIFTVLNWLRLIEVIRQWQYLQSLLSTLPLLYLAITGLIWGLAGTVLLWGLILGRPWSPHLTRNSALLYTLCYWADRLLLADPSTINHRWPFVLALTLALLAFIFWTLARPKVQAFFLHH